MAGPAPFQPGGNVAETTLSGKDFLPCPIFPVGIPYSTMKKLVYTVYHYFGKKVDRWTFRSIEDVSTKLNEITQGKHGEVVVQTQEI